MTVRQLSLLPPESTTLNPAEWHGSFNGRESTLQQLSPYVGKLKSGMVQAILRRYSEPGDWVLDPFCGSGVVPLECLLHDRRAMANDLSPYAYHLTLGKVTAPPSEREALRLAESALTAIERASQSVNLDAIPKHVRQYFHPDTLREVAAAFRVLRRRKQHFLLACLMGILHHVRPGFLSFPASHVTPYLRTRKYPRDEFPEMYAYRPLRPRLLAKVVRSYRRTLTTRAWTPSDYRITCENSMALSLECASVDLIVSSPPYFGALDYARDNRLRLWFLGCKDWHKLDRTLTASNRVYLPQMRACMAEMNRVLKSGSRCVLVLGDVERDGAPKKTAEIIGQLAEEVTGGSMSVEQLIADRIPDIRRSRRRTHTTKVEKVLVLRKKTTAVRHPAEKHEASRELAPAAIS